MDRSEHIEYVLEQAKRTIVERKLADSQTLALLMVSGGSDSTALSYIAKALFEEGVIGDLAMLHVNHQLRGEDADADQAFVEQLANALEIPLFICEVDVAAQARLSNENIEAVARQERYLAANEALSSFCRHRAAPLAEGRIFTAHTQNDRVENFYMRSIVGTGPGGFRSMKYTNGPVVRPLLDLSRNDLRTYIAEREAGGEPTTCSQDGHLWCEDATNAHTDKFRAYVRHEIVPKAEARNPQLFETLCRSMNLIADEDDMLREEAGRIIEKEIIWTEQSEQGEVVYSTGCVITPEFGTYPVPLQRRAVMQLLQLILGADVRIETATVEALLLFWENGAPISGKTDNIQGDLAVSSNKREVRIEPMTVYRARRKKK